MLEIILILFSSQPLLSLQTLRRSWTRKDELNWTTRCRMCPASRRTIASARRSWLCTRAGAKSTSASGDASTSSSAIPLRPESPSSKCPSPWQSLRPRAKSSRRTPSSWPSCARCTQGPWRHWPAETKQPLKHFWPMLARCDSSPANNIDHNQQHPKEPFHHLNVSRLFLKEISLKTLSSKILWWANETNFTQLCFFN